MYRHSVEGKLPSWIADYLDAGKPKELIESPASDRFKGHVPRVIRPDVILTNDHFFIAELDSVPGGIGLTGWLGKTYARVGRPRSSAGARDDGGIRRDSARRVEERRTAGRRGRVG